MRLICPSCGAIASLEAWINDNEARCVLAIFANMDAELAGLLVKYLALFRPKKRSLSWQRTRKIVTELKELIFANKIFWEKESLPNMPVFWLKALEVVLERDSSGKLRKPLKNNNLLRVIAFEIASRQAEAYTNVGAIEPKTKGKKESKKKLVSPEKVKNFLKEFRKLENGKNDK